MTRFSSSLGLLLPLAALLVVPSANAFSVTTNVPHRTAAAAPRSATTLSLFKSASSSKSKNKTSKRTQPLNVGTAAMYSSPFVLEDKPQLMIGGRGYRNFVVDMDELATIGAQAKADRRRKIAIKFAAGYTAAICAALVLRQFPLFLANIPSYYKAYPLLASMATCGFKSFAADLISQFQSFRSSDAFDYCWKRTVSGLTYGAAILGLGSNFAYNQIMPRLPSIAARCAMDNLVLAPLIWLPGAYLVKSLFFRTPLKEGLFKQYWNDIVQERLLLKYWCLWGPAQFFNFAIMPQHFRVAFTAGIGFLWFLILSNLTYKDEES